MLWRIAIVAFVLFLVGMLIESAVTDPLRTAGTLSILIAFLLGLWAMELGQDRRWVTFAAVALAVAGLVTFIALLSPMAAGCFAVVAPVLWFYFWWSEVRDPRTARAREALGKTRGLQSCLP